MVMYSLICGDIGDTIAALNYTLHQPAKLGASLSVATTAKIIDIGGRASGLSRLWLEATHTKALHQKLSNVRLRLSSKDKTTVAIISTVVEIRERLFPPLVMIRKLLLLSR